MAISYDWFAVIYHQKYYFYVYLKIVNKNYSFHDEDINFW